MAEERCKFITYKGKEIFLGTYTGLRKSEILEQFKQANKLVDSCGKSGMLLLSDFTDCVPDQESVDYLKNEESKRIAKKFRKTAVVGRITGVKKIFLNGYNTITGANAKIFNTLDEAKEWLVAD